ncbi:hypothetical protein [Thermogemmatispora onikobensis]|uniref:hypothetical protein n=1 Tax=Thermogemmatispora onikobensis TaxID=732234 RepID=UPI00159F05CC|nr:hypothetical protein [Thermogemmatispora onikobensis]
MIGLTLAVGAGVQWSVYRATGLVRSLEGGGASGAVGRAGLELHDVCSLTAKG